MVSAAASAVASVAVPVVASVGAGVVVVAPADGEASPGLADAPGAPARATTRQAASAVGMRSAEIFMAGPLLGGQSVNST